MNWSTSSKASNLFPVLICTGGELSKAVVIISIIPSFHQLRWSRRAQSVTDQDTSLKQKVAQVTLWEIPLQPSVTMSSHLCPLSLATASSAFQKVWSIPYSLQERAELFPLWGSSQEVSRFHIFTRVGVCLKASFWESSKQLRTTEDQCNVTSDPPPI